MSNCNCKNGSTMANPACPECDILQMARNNYFTGKLLVERDFTDEQRYQMGKLRRHNQRLHGWGAVCGLKVKQHPNPACQGQFVLIEPGTAIDCCGREILVTHEEYFDFTSQFLANWQKQNGPNTPPDSNPHTIQICVSYRECPTEDVPVLFEECSCDATSCRPNRILESYEFDVVIDPLALPVDPQGVQLQWSCTVNIANPVRVAENDATNRLYVLTSATDTATLYAVDATNGSIVASQTFAQNTGVDVAVSPAGDFVYVALQPAGQNAAAPDILVLGSQDLTATVNTLKPPNATPGDKLRLAVVPAPDGRLQAVVPSQNAVLIWGTDINSANPPPASPKSVSVGTKPIDVAVGDNGMYAYVANTGDNSAGSGTVSAITLSTTPPVATQVNAGLPQNAAPTSIAVATTTAGDIVALLDGAAKTLYFISIPSSGPGSAKAIGKPVTGFGYSPLEVDLSPGGRWAYVLEQDSTSNNKAYLQVVDEHAVKLQKTNILGNPIPVGFPPVSEARSENGTELYVAYAGDGKSIPGGVAVINVMQADCPDLFRRAIEGCPDCAKGNCIVLATVENYVYQQSVTDGEIDNLKDRHLLASTEMLTEVVRCILDEGTGGGKAGPQGPPGLPGTPGAGIVDVAVDFVTCDQPGSASLSGNAPNLTLNLTIPGPCNHDLVGIKEISWKHNQPYPLSSFLKDQHLSIAFTGNVNAGDLTSEVVAVLTETSNPDLETNCWCELNIEVQAGNFATPGDVTTSFTVVNNSASPANGLRITFPQGVIARFRNLKKVTTLRIRVKGDFIRDTTNQQRAVDLDHLPPWLPNRLTGDGIEGGIFESWFSLSPDNQ